MASMAIAELRGYQQICGGNGAIMVIAREQRAGSKSDVARDPRRLAQAG